MIGGRSEAAYRVYGRLSSATARRDALEQAGIAFYYSQNSQKPPSQFNKLVDLQEWGTARRNELAHGYVMQRPWFIGYYLAPGEYNARKRAIGIWREPVYLYNSDNIYEIAEKFMTLRDAARTYVFALMDELGLSPF